MRHGRARPSAPRCSSMPPGRGWVMCSAAWLRPTRRRRCGWSRAATSSCRKLFDHDRCYIFQNSDGRIIFAIPYEGDFTLIGTTDQDYRGRSRRGRARRGEIDYLCAAASDYFRGPVGAGDVVWTYSGVRPLYDDGASQGAGGDARLRAEAGRHGGRRAAALRLRRQDHDLSPAGRGGDGELGAHLPAAARPPGRPARRCRAATSRETGSRRWWPSLARAALAPRPAAGRAAGARLRHTGRDACWPGRQSMADLGRVFGADLTEARGAATWCDQEWAVHGR